MVGNGRFEKIVFLGLLGCVAVSCKSSLHGDPSPDATLHAEFVRAVRQDLENRNDVMDISAEGHVERFVRQHGVTALSVYEGVIRGAAAGQSPLEQEEVHFAVDALVQLRGAEARGVLEGLIFDKRVQPDLSDHALRQLVMKLSDDEKVVVLGRRLREFDDEEDRLRTIGYLVKTGLADAAGPIKAIKAGESRETVLRRIDWALELLRDPSVCLLSQVAYREKFQLWSCRYTCPGPVLWKTIYVKNECGASMKQAEVDAIRSATP